MRLNCRPGVSIAIGCSIHPTALFDLTGGGSIVLGRNVQICAGAMLSPHGGQIRLADNSYVGPYCVLYGHGGLSVGRDTMIAAQSIIIPANHGFERTDMPIGSQPLTQIGIEIGPDCWIGCGVKVLDGVHIGQGCVVGAGAVVTQSLLERSVAVGVPARVIRLREVSERPADAVAAIAEIGL